MKSLFTPILIASAVLLLPGCVKDEITTDSEGTPSQATLADTGLSWSEPSCTVTYGEEDSYVFPSLNNPNNLDVSYASSNVNVATVAADGSVTILAQGETAISASTEATDAFLAGRVSYTLTVEGNLLSAGISWSSGSCSAVLEADDNVFPPLNNPNGLKVVYSSSAPSVASIDAASGTITLKSTGATTITAVTEANDTFASGYASYTLTVTSSADDGAGSWTYPSSGDPSSDDDISTTTFTRMVTVTYASAGAAVSGYAASSALGVSVSGNSVTITNTGDENIIYKLTGSASDGCFKLYSAKKMALVLSDLSLSSASGAAINIQSEKRCYVVVEGTNTLADGSSAAYSASGDEDMKAVFFSEGQLVFSGSGDLTVTANNKQAKSCIASDDYVRFLNAPSVTVSAGSSAGHGIRGNDYVRLSGGTLSVTTTAATKKGISSDGYVLVEGGTSTINVSGGVAYDSEDAEYKGTAGIKADNYFGMTGGSVTIKNTGAGGKGVHAGSYDYYKTNGSLGDSYISGGTLTVTTTGSESNDVSSKAIKIGYKEGSGRNYVCGGNLRISSGTIVASASRSETIETKGTLAISGGEIYSTSSADDAINSYGNMTISGGYLYTYTTKGDSIDANGNLTISGGHVFAVTTSGSPEVALDANTEGGYKLYITGGVVVAYGGLENGYSASNTVYTLSGTAGAWNALYNGSSFIAAFKAPSGLSSFVVCAPSLSAGYKGVSVGGTTFCNGIWATSGISGGTAVSLSTYSGGQGGPGGGGPGGGGGGRW